MFPILKISVIYLVIPSCIYTSSTNGDGSTKTLNSGELVEKELAPIEENLKIIVDSKTSNDIKLDLKGEVRGSVKKIIERAIRAERRIEHLNFEKGGLDKAKKIADENILLNIWRLLIDNYEESFPQPYDDDFDNKKVKYDKSKFTNLVKYDLYEERRRQRWLFYCNNPPSKKMSHLVSSLSKENVDCDTFSCGVAKAYRLFSDKFHSGFHKIIRGDPKKYFMFKNVVIAMRMLLKQEDILDELIEQTVPDLLGQN